MNDSIYTHTNGGGSLRRHYPHMNTHGGTGRATHPLGLGKKFPLASSASAPISIVPPLETLPEHTAGRRGRGSKLDLLERAGVRGDAGGSCPVFPDISHKKTLLERAGVTGGADSTTRLATLITSPQPTYQSELARLRTILAEHEGVVIIAGDLHTSDNPPKVYIIAVASYGYDPFTPLGQHLNTVPMGLYFIDFTASVGYRLKVSYCWEYYGGNLCLIDGGTVVAGGAS